MNKDMYLKLGCSARTGRIRKLRIDRHDKEASSPRRRLPRPCLVLRAILRELTSASDLERSRRSVRLSLAVVSLGPFYFLGEFMGEFLEGFLQNNKFRMVSNSSAQDGIVMNSYTSHYLAPTSSRGVVSSSQKMGSSGS